MNSSDQGQASYGEGDASFQAAGGEQGVFKLVHDFYHQMTILPEARVIRGMHAEDLSQSIDKLACFLCGWLGGPKLYREKYGEIRIPVAHRHLDIGLAERDAWLLCMEKAIALQPFAEEFKAYLLRELFVPAERSRTRN